MSDISNVKSVVAAGVVALGCGAAMADGAVKKEASFADFDNRAKAGEKLTVVYFGGSLTWSANATEPNRTGFRGRMSDYLTDKYPKAHFTFIDAAIGGTGSNLGMFRLERDVLAYKPDLVFLDFICNDGGENRALFNTCCYEYLLRRMIGEGIPVVQMFFTFKSWALHGAPYDVDGCHPRLKDYYELVKAYSTAVGDVYKDGLIPAIDSGVIAEDRKEAIEKVWPIDGGHPDDIGYYYFGKAGEAGFERAVAAGLVCKVPEKPVFGTVKDVVRFNPAYKPLPPGWSRKLTYRTSAWYDGLPSRWMEDVAAFAGKEPTALSVKAKGNFLGIFGESDADGIKFDFLADGEKYISGDSKSGVGRLFIWRFKSLADWSDGKSVEREFSIVPVPADNGKGELHIGSICTATVVPEPEALAAEKSRDQEKEAAKAAAEALEKLDHARGK